MNTLVLFAAYRLLTRRDVDPNTANQVETTSSDSLTWVVGILLLVAIGFVFRARIWRELQIQGQRIRRLWTRSRSGSTPEAKAIGDHSSPEGKDIQPLPPGLEA
jgi:hypothetical protein